MKYREKLLELIFDKNENAFIDWLTAQPLLEQVEILKEFKKMSFQKMFESQNFTVSKTLKKFKKQIDKYQDAVLVEIDAENKYNEALKKQEEVFAEMDVRVAGVRRYIMDCIINKEENAEAMLELAHKIMQSEKDNDLFDPENWVAIL